MHSLRKITKNDSQLRYVCTDIRPQEKIRLPVEGLSWNLKFEDISKICGEKSSLIDTDKNNRYFTWRPIYIYYGNKVEYFLQWEKFNKSL
jgi:hypothetical protein